MFNKNQKCYLLGHRAARAELLENSKQGFAYIQQLHHHGKRLDGVEFDIQMTADGEFVVVHDETLTRLANQQSWVADRTLDELSAVTQSDLPRFEQSYQPGFLQQKILPLNDLLPFLQGFRHIELEIKTHVKTDQQRLVQNLLRLLLDESWQQLPLTLTSFDTDILYAIQNQQRLPATFSTGLLLAPNTTLSTQIAFSPTPDKAGESLIVQTFNRACILDCAQIGVYYALITPRLVEIANRYGLKVTAWTVNDIAVAKNLMKMGVDCVITDYPTEFLAKLSD